MGRDALLARAERGDYFEICAPMQRDQIFFLKEACARSAVLDVRRINDVQ